MASAQTALPPLARTTSSNAGAAAIHGNPGTSAAASSAAFHRRTSLSSFPSSRSGSQMSHNSRPSNRSPQPPTARMSETDQTSDPRSKSKTSSTGTGVSSQHSSLSNGAAPPRPYNPKAHPRRRLRSQYPRGNTENHVEYILVASFDIDRGPVMEHQYPVAITGDEHMLAELMLPDQAHVRNQDWTMFFLHKDTSQEEEDEERKAKEERRRRRRRRRDRAKGILHESDDEDEDEDGRVGSDGDWDDDDDDDSTDSEPEGGEGPPLIYAPW
ncbi:hypothetical protein VTK73DRAFT_6438 [Phialemonium thermophilum]|uniref:Arf3-interacting protein 1 N-terminal domain-containing protein n=1 Tax=Phialemonium thermophilum TaxID=223376 RepID=A0ABR3V064_9PEZI